MTTVVKSEVVLEVKNLRTYFYTQEGELKQLTGLPTMSTKVKVSAL